MDHPAVVLKKNGIISDEMTAFVIGDKVSLSIEKNGNWGGSRIEIFDPRGNLRYMSRQLGDHIFGFMFPPTRTFGDWNYSIQLKDLMGEVTFLKEALNLKEESDDATSSPSDFEEIEEEKNETKSEKPTEIQYEELHEDTIPDDNDTILELKNGEGESVSEDLDVPAVVEVELSQDKVADEDEEEEINDFVEETIEFPIEDLDESLVEGPIEIEVMLLNEEAKTDFITQLDTIEDLQSIAPFILEEDVKNDLEIPIAEMEEIQKDFHSNLKEANILYISNILEESPSRLFEISGATLADIKGWLLQSYHIHADKDHPLRKEYRKIRTEYHEFQRQLETLMDSKMANDPLSALVGVDNTAMERLKGEGILTVGGLLQIPMVDLINLEVDPDKPLLPKLWIANAKSYVGIK